MKKPQALVLRILIIVLLGGITISYYSNQPDKDANISQIHKNNLPENSSSFLAEEEISSEEPSVRKNVIAFDLCFEMSRSLPLAYQKKNAIRPLPLEEQEKKFLLHLQLLI